MVDLRFAAPAAAVIASVFLFLFLLNLASCRRHGSAGASMVHHRRANAGLKRVGSLSHRRGRIRARKGMRGALVRKHTCRRGARTDPRHCLHLRHEKVRIRIIHRTRGRGHLARRAGQLRIVNHPRDRIIQRRHHRRASIMCRAQMRRATRTAGRVGVHTEDMGAVRMQRVRRRIGVHAFHRGHGVSSLHSLDSLQSLHHHWHVCQLRRGLRSRRHINR